MVCRAGAYELQQGGVDGLQQAGVRRQAAQQALDIGWGSPGAGEYDIALDCVAGEHRGAVVDL